MSTGKLAGRVAIITGSGGGLGAECARVLASHGASIAVVDINFEGATAVAQSLLAEGHQALATHRRLLGRRRARDGCSG